MLHNLTDSFIQYIEDQLQNSPTGIKEYDLLSLLTEKGLFQAFKGNGSHELFQKHFLIFHALYLINDKLIHNKQGSLTISPLLIQQLSYTEASKNLGHFDPLREYYLDLNNLEESNEETVNELLNSFWELYLRNDKRQGALSALDLVDPVNDHEIKSAYRRLVNTHHPDKGGDKSKIQEINEAYKILIKP